MNLKGKLYVYVGIMALFRITSDTLLFKAVDTYSSYLLEEECIKNPSDDNSLVEFNVSSSRSLRVRDNVRELKYLIPYGKSVIPFKGIYIHLEMNKLGKNPLEMCGTVSYYKEIKLEHSSLSKLKDFVGASFEYYNLNVLDKIKENNKFTCWIWDDYWEDLYKRKKRYMKSISLSGKELELLNYIKDFLSDKTQEKYELLGIPAKKNILLEGIPGTGKTSLIYALASELDMDVAILHFDPKLTDTQFMKATQRIPENTILVLEDIDTLFESKEKNDENKSIITFSGILNNLDGLGYQEKLITIITTNHKDKLDAALTRPGRIDKIVHFDYANKEQIEHMYLRFIPNQKDNFNEFYKNIKRLKITTAALQQFLFTNIECDNIIECIPELEKLANDNNYSENYVMYT